MQLSEMSQLVASKSNHIVRRIRTNSTACKPEPLDETLTLLIVTES